MNIARDILSATHSQYQKRKENWDFFLQSYEGGSNYFTEENIFTHTREHADDYNWRLKRVHYQNYCESIISVYTGHLFKKPIVRQTEDEEFVAFFENVDRQNSNINDFFKNVADLMQAHGHVYVLVDKPRTNGEIQTKADEMANNVTPYYTIVYPQNCINWELDTDGNFEWVRLQEIIQRQSDPFKKPETVTFYRTFTRDKWWVHDKDGKEIDAGVHMLGEVPLIPIYNKRLKRYPLFGWSAIEDIAYINRALANITSLLDEFIYRQCFEILIWPSEGISTTEESEGEMQLSTKNIMAVRGDVGFAPFYLSPSTAGAQFLMEYARELRAIIYMLAKVEAPAFEPVAASGVSKQWSFHETNQSLADKADNLENAERTCHRLRAKWMDKEWDGVIDYPEDFDIRRINEELEEALNVQIYGFPPSFTSEYSKQLYRKLLPKLGKDIMAKIDTDIEKGVKSMNNVTEAEEETVKKITERLRGL
jgi:hypothetical protein